MAWSYNAGAVNGLTALVPANSGMTGLATTGNALNAVVDPPQVRHVEYSPPGSSWTARRTAGLPMRRVIWAWQVAAAAEADLNTVEAAIEAYLKDGREYTLTDGIRSNSSVVMVSNGTGRVGSRRKLPDGRYLQRWRIEFGILRPLVGVTSL